ncbi:MAG: LysR family transcriptional regulator [Cyanobacteria bacterium P01_F01_bin.53]
MKDDRLSGLTAFVQVVRVGGFRKAASELGMSAASVSEAVSRLEKRIGVGLLKRTTRKISLTEAGKDFYARCGPALDSIADAIETIQDSQKKVAGTLRLTAPWSAGPIFLNQLVATFLQAYPDVVVDLNYDARKLDLVSSGVDAAIRSDNLLEQDSQALPMGPKLPMCVVASPDYLARMGTPKLPADLNNHAGIYFRLSANNMLAPWVFVSKKERYTVTPRQRLIVNDAQAAIEMAERGLGMTYTYRAFAQSQIENGQLIALFPKAADVRPSFYLNFLSRRHMPLKLSAFISLSKEQGLIHSSING